MSYIEVKGSRGGRTEGQRGLYDFGCLGQLLPLRRCLRMFFNLRDVYSATLRCLLLATRVDAKERANLGIVVDKLSKS
jgi:hypothetical protein